MTEDLSVMGMACPTVVRVPTRAEALATASRVQELFTCRRLAEHADISGIRLSPVFWLRLSQLQSTIYDLDSYFETSWAIEDTQLRRLWSGIHCELEALSVGRDVTILASDIKRYERVERSLRSGTLKSLPALKRYYYLKTCDVRLSRILIEQRGPSERRSERLAAWNRFDMISEVLDDLEDLDEDAADFNGNRLLLGVGESGATKTLAKYGRLLSCMGREVALSLTSTRSSAERIPLLWAKERTQHVRSQLAAWGWKSPVLEEVWERCALARRV